ncbi:hypothetical protein K402DRAFT_19312 [Aulographum hederae CBS 113979]|uniref:Uncharacterized protein n=1 Tax=Aulographum hederae CBS 113979 TaxID=1176131 RepID=A0A6G1H6A3_9PEZI|nr:hypothetical protein K402DRAFT_19312 [Aulographum hederae CBS 113979]
MEERINTTMRKSQQNANNNQSNSIKSKTTQTRYTTRTPDSKSIRRINLDTIYSLDRTNFNPSISSTSPSSTPSKGSTPFNPNLSNPSTSSLSSGDGLRLGQPPGTLHDGLRLLADRLPGTSYSGRGTLFTSARLPGTSYGFPLHQTLASSASSASSASFALNSSSLSASRARDSSAISAALAASSTCFFAFLVFSTA